MKQQPLEQKAKEFATWAHEGQLRKDGKARYITHPAAVVSLLKEAKIKDEKTLVVGWLHDTIEDSTEKRVTYTLLQRKFGKEIAQDVQQLTRDCSRAEYRLRIIRANSTVKIVKIADFIHNCQTLNELLPYKTIINKVEDYEFYAGLTKVECSNLYKNLQEAIAPWMREQSLTGKVYASNTFVMGKWYSPIVAANGKYWMEDGFD